METIEIKDVAEFKALEGLERVYSSPAKYGDVGETVDTYRFTRDGVVYEVMFCAHADGEPDPRSFPARAYVLRVKVSDCVGIGTPEADAVRAPATDFESLESRIINIETMVAKILGMMEENGWAPEAIEADGFGSTGCRIDMSTGKLYEHDGTPIDGLGLNKPEATVNECDPSTRNLMLSAADVPWTDPVTGTVLDRPGMYSLSNEKDDDHE